MPSSASSAMRSAIAFAALATVLEFVLLERMFAYLAAGAIV